LTLDPLIIPAYQVLADIGSPIKVSDYLDHGKIEKTWIHNNSKIGFHAIKEYALLLIFLMDHRIASQM
jgi:hypothetical protein